MIIVSQDKTQIFNFNEIFRLYIDNWSSEEFAIEPNCFCIRAEKASDNMICAFLGEYATEERAKEVLALIYKIYADQMLIKHTRGDIQTALMQGDPNKYFDVFEMPEN